ncbi:hypothetical protein [Streptomyces sp. SAJ15]|uniref:hypothetical protein n=1 Tax=Streptomyces sp. SAJ15 TaxID=2011095 RepID=UPI001186167A|nr:hypothetical protein [Streptomyces sp. SAJ15]TVL87791.1 hypothetical protein CD790_32940 [Streptomyces sp. SAJ15]
MPDAQEPDFSQLGDGAETDTALDAVRAVANWYTQQIAAERRTPLPDEERMEELKAARQAALDDQARLYAASPEDKTRIARAYAARLKELMEP